MIDLSQFKIWTEERFERAFPPPPSPVKPNGRGTGGGGRRRKKLRRRDRASARICRMASGNGSDGWRSEKREKTARSCYSGCDQGVASRNSAMALRRSSSSLDRYPNGISTEKYRNRPESYSWVARVSLQEGGRARLRQNASAPKSGLSANPPASSPPVVNLRSPSPAAANPPALNLVAPNPGACASRAVLFASPLSAAADRMRMQLSKSG